MIEIPIHAVHPTNVSIEPDPEDSELWRIVLRSGQGVHHIVMPRKRLETLGREIQQKLQAKNATSARE